MAQRRKIALVYTYNENWIGGTYYVENLISALSQLPDEQQPELLIFSVNVADAERLRQAVQYMHWSFHAIQLKLPFISRAVNKLSNILLKKPLIRAVHREVGAELVFPLPLSWHRYFYKIPHHLYWIPDFQEHYLPEFFDSAELESRKREQKLMLDTAHNIVFSSQQVQRDFNVLYPGNYIAQYVLQFAVTSRVTSEPEIECLARYNITCPYFICSNQFWKHKNHPVVLRALHELRHTHPDALVVFTGKNFDSRNPDYYSDLMNLHKELGLEPVAKFLGFIPRQDQLALMQGALAVIQPSLFEGWSTSVEDAKSLGVPLLVSELDVHKEQLMTYQAKRFFAPSDAHTLAMHMAAALDGGLPSNQYEYQKDITRFAETFMRIVQDVTAK
jgi:glycosyltransferase involved in cell wall biosynthesis